MKSILHRTTMQLLLIIVLLGCVLLGCFPLWKTHSKYHRYLNKDNHEHESCLTLVAELNDTLFFKDSIIAKLDNLPDDYNNEELSQILPTVRVLIKNTCDYDLLIPYYNLCCGPSTRLLKRNTNGSVIAYTIGNKDSIIDMTPYIKPDYIMADLDCITWSILQQSVVGLYKELISKEEVYAEDILTPFNEYDSKCISDTGLYWMRVALRNYLVEDSNIPIWTGIVWSDTVWFRVK